MMGYTAAMVKRRRKTRERV